MSRRSIGFPLTIGIVLSVLALALGVGWQILVVSDLAPVARGLTGVHWLLLILGGKARAILHGRTYVSPEDIQAVAYPVLVPRDLDV